MAKAYGGKLEKERRQLILDAAAACVREFGIDGATMKRVAAKAGVSTGMIAYYFQDKDQLMTATMSGAAAAFRERLTREAGDAPSLERLRKVFELSFPAGPTESFSSWPLWLEFAAQARRSPALNQQLQERIATIRADFSRCISSASEDGAASDSGLLADLLLALYHGLGVLTTTSEKAMSPERAHDIELLAMSFLPSD